jgi:hypothetical protein
VRLKNGGLVHGTISELVPEQRVEIITAGGKPRSYPMSDVSYAGPVSEEPKEATASDPDAPTATDDDTPRPMATVKAGESNVEFRSEGDTLTLHRQDSTAIAVGPGGAAVAAGFTEICTASCSATIASGTRTLGLSRKSGQVPARAKPITLPEGDVTYTGQLKSRAGVRWAGVGGASVGIVGGTLLLLSQTSSGDLQGGGIGGSVALMCGGVVIGTVMTLVRDKVDLEVSQAQSTGHAGQRRSPQFWIGA